MPNLGNIQAIVAKSSPKPLITVLLFKLGAADGAKSFLREWIVNTPAGAASNVGGQPAFYFLFSWNGLEVLLRDHAQLDVAQGRRQFETFFVDPVQAPDGPAVAEQLGFLGASAPERWWDRKFTSRDIDLAVYASFDTSEQKSENLDRLRQSAARHGLQELKLPTFADSALSGQRPADGRLHFGYRDGVTSPTIDWDDTRGAGTVNFREFVVGYPNEDYPTAPQRAGAWQDFARDGSYAALAWIHQDVAGFNQFLRTNAPATAPHVAPDQAEEWLAAKLMGRWRDGSPLSKYPDLPPQPPQLDDNFGYADDPAGIKCPLMSHIRVANLRDQPMKFANRVRFPGGPPRLLRRGFSYGPSLHGVQDDGLDRGLVGLFFFARVNEQFYTVLILLSQKVAGFVEENHVFGKIHSSACGGLRWVCQNQVTLHRGFRGMSRV
jgi:deferrochelatase/peroxidase EfeB